MFNFFPQIIILLCLAGVIVIIARKFPALAEAEERGLRRIPTINKAVFKEKTKILGLAIKNFCLFVFKNIVGQITRIKIVLRETRKAPQVAQKQLKHLTARRPSPTQARKQEVSKLEAVVDPLVLLNKASSLVKNDKLDEAEKIYIEVVKKDPKNIKAYWALGEIYLKRHNFGDAKAAFRQVKKLDPGDEEAQLQLKKLDEATEEATEKIEGKQVPR